MNYKKKIFSIVIALLFSSVIYSCSSALYEPDLRNIKDEVVLVRLKEGRKSYIQRCGSCHNLYLPEKYTKSEWNDWLGKMEKKANLTEKEKSLIFEYLTYGK